MDGSPNRTFQVNELAHDPAVTFDPKVAKDYVTYAHRIAARGLVNSSVGGITALTSGRSRRISRFIW
jgi:hypothetical protein